MAPCRGGSETRPYGTGGVVTIILPDAPVETAPRRLLCRALAAGHVIVDAGCEFFAWQLARDGLAVVHTRPRALDPSTGSGGCGQLTWIEPTPAARLAWGDGWPLSEANPHPEEPSVAARGEGGRLEG